MTKIEWTDKVWNPVTGCSKISEGCRNCYAEKMSHRFKWTDKPWNHVNAVENVKLHPERLEQPLKWKKQQRIFVNSMSDLFHEQVPFEFIDKVFAIMALTPKHTYQILTKRPERMLKYFCEHLPEKELEIAMFLGNVAFEITNDIDSDMFASYRIAVGSNKPEWPLPNVWLGVSIENQKAADERIPYLLETPAHIRFLSCEPLLSEVDLTFFVQVLHPMNEGYGFVAIEGIDWVIVGGESGPNARPMHPDWARSLRDQCQEVGVPFFFKQWGGKNKSKTGRSLDGREWNEMPKGE